jgi:hypothetical protein
VLAALRAILVLEKAAAAWEAVVAVEAAVVERGVEMEAG